MNPKKKKNEEIDATKSMLHLWRMGRGNRKKGLEKILCVGVAPAG